MTDEPSSDHDPAASEATDPGAVDRGERDRDRDDRVRALRRERHEDRRVALSELGEGHRRVLRSASREIRDLVRNALVELNPPPPASAPPADAEPDAELRDVATRLGRVVATRHREALVTAEARQALRRIEELEASIEGELERAGEAIRASSPDGLLDALRVTLGTRGGGRAGSRSPAADGRAAATPAGPDLGAVEAELDAAFARLGQLALADAGLTPIDDPDLRAMLDEADHLNARRPPVAAPQSAASLPAGAASLVLAPDSLRILKHRVKRARDALVQLDEDLNKRLEEARRRELAFLDELAAAERRLEAVRLETYAREEELRAARLELAERNAAAERERRETCEIEARAEQEAHQMRLREEEARRETEAAAHRQRLAEIDQEHTRSLERTREVQALKDRTERETVELRKRATDRSSGARELAEIRAHRHLMAQLRGRLLLFGLAATVALGALVFAGLYLSGGLALLADVARGERVIEFGEGYIRVAEPPPATHEE